MAMRRKVKGSKKKGAARKKKTARRAPARRKAGKKKVAAKRADPAAALSAFARKIVKTTLENGDFMSLYSPDVVSTEGTGQTVHGHAGLAEKLKGWEQMQESATWKARSVCLDPRSGTICVEWEGQVKLRGGPTVRMVEAAIHEVKNGKIVAERYYYNPGALAGGQQAPPA
jgi:hypothetical protein